MAAGREISFSPGDELFQEGLPADHLWILLEGRVELSRRSANQTIVLATMSTPGQWAGGLTAWGDADEAAGYRATGHAVTDGRGSSCRRTRSGASSVSGCRSAST